MKDAEWHMIHVMLIATSHFLVHSTYGNVSSCPELCLRKKCEVEVTNVIYIIIKFKAFVMKYELLSLILKF